MSQELEKKPYATSFRFKSVTLYKVGKDYANPEVTLHDGQNGMLVSFQYNEDIMWPSFGGTMVIVDNAQNIISDMPIQGYERVVVEVDDLTGKGRNNNGGVYTYEFRIHSVFNRVSNNSNLSGYFISIPLFLIINGLVSWLLFLLLENYIISNLISASLLVSFSIYELYRNRFLYIKKLNIFIVGAILIAIFQIVYLIYRSFNPDLIGTEKIMDFMMLSSVYNSSGGAVKDIWFSGSLNPYYYFGYWIYSSLLKLLFIDLDIGYNLLLSITFSLSIVVSGAISYNYLSNKINRILYG